MKKLFGCALLTLGSAVAAFAQSPDATSGPTLGTAPIDFAGTSAAHVTLLEPVNYSQPSFLPAAPTGASASRKDWTGAALVSTADPAPAEPEPKFVFGGRDDFRFQLVKARPNGLMPWHIIGEWNTLWGYDGTPVGAVQNMPAGAADGLPEGTGAYSNGLFPNLIRNYLKDRDQLLAVINFVDENLGGATWAGTAMRVNGDNNLDQVQRSRLANWDTDFDSLMRAGW